MEKIKLNFATPNYDVVANAFGYGTHIRMMRKYMEPYFEYDDSAKIAMQIVPADKFVPIPGKVNVLFTMWEMLTIPMSYQLALDRADVIIVPSKWCKDLFRKYTSNPIYVCNEGIEPQTFPFYQRNIPIKGERFRFLWVGAPNPRKGYEAVGIAANILQRSPDAEIYIKTSMPKMNWTKTLQNAWAKRREILSFERTGAREAFIRMIRRIPSPRTEGVVKVTGAHKNIIIDTRKISSKELVQLYNSAHCFILPTFGEGWGLTLCEAMATGCPCIATHVTGVKDFFDEKVGVPLKHKIVKQILTNYGNMETDSYCPDVDDLINKMFAVAREYPAMLKLGKKASDRIHRKYTWDHAAIRMRSIISEVHRAFVV